MCHVACSCSAFLSCQAVNPLQMLCRCCINIDVTWSADVTSVDWMCSILIFNMLKADARLANDCSRICPVRLSIWRVISCITTSRLVSPACTAQNAATNRRHTSKRWDKCRDGETHGTTCRRSQRQPGSQTLTTWLMLAGSWLHTPAVGVAER